MAHHATLTIVSVALPTTIAIAILRHQLFDIRLVLSRTLTYGSLVVGVVTSYALMLLAAQRLGGNGSAGGLLAVAVVAVAVQPAHSWLRHGSNGGSTVTAPSRTRPYDCSRTGPMR